MQRLQMKPNDYLFGFFRTLEETERSNLRYAIDLAMVNAVEWMRHDSSQQLCLQQTG
jgi:hypothetical protein